MPYPRGPGRTGRLPVPMKPTRSVSTTSPSRLGRICASLLNFLREPALACSFQPENPPVRQDDEPAVILGPLKLVQHRSDLVAAVFKPKGDRISPAGHRFHLGGRRLAAFSVVFSV